MSRRSPWYVWPVSYTMPWPTLPIRPSTARPRNHQSRSAIEHNPSFVPDQWQANILSMLLCTDSSLYTKKIPHLFSVHPWSVDSFFGSILTPTSFAMQSSHLDHRSPTKALVPTSYQSACPDLLPSVVMLDLKSMLQHHRMAARRVWGIREIVRSWVATCGIKGGRVCVVERDG